MKIVLIKYPQNRLITKTLLISITVVLFFPVVYSELVMAQAMTNTCIHLGAFAHTQRALGSYLSLQLCIIESD